MEIERNRNSWPRPSMPLPPAKEGELPPPVPRERSPEPSNDENSLYKVFRQPQKIEIIQRAGFHGGPVSRRRGYSLAAWSWLASLIDALVLISISCVFLLSFSWILRATGLHALRTPMLAREFSWVFLFCSWVYMVSLRVWTGSSIGEWACDLRLGQPHERLQSRYAWRVILRESLILLSGVILLPLMSLLLGRDVAGQISGLKLFSLK